MFTSDPDGHLPPLPPRWSDDPAHAAQAARDLDRALDDLAGVPWPLAGVHDFDRADAQGRCRRPRCRVPFLDAGPDCPGAEPDELTDAELDARLAAAREDLGRHLAAQLDMDAGLAAITGQACRQPHPPGTHDSCPPGAPCHRDGPR